MSKNLEYKVMVAKAAADLSATVTAELARGWALHGSPHVAYGKKSDGQEIIFIQAMTKEEKKNRTVGAL